MPPLTKSCDINKNTSPFRAAQVDILIPFHGQYKRVRDLVESVLLHTVNCQHLITLIDDGSPNTSFLPSVAKSAPVHTVRLDEQRGFAAAVNAGYRHTVHPWVVVLHSDCLIRQRNWMQHLGESLLALRGDNVRLVHARTNTPTVDHPDLPPSPVEQSTSDRVVATDDPLPLVACMFHRELLNRLGGPLQEYPYAGYENVELFYRMKRNGFRQAVCGRAWVEHAGGATISEMDRKQRLMMESNYDLCLRDLKR